MIRLATLATVAVSLAACGGQKGTLTIQAAVAPGDDPFVEAAQARVRVGDDAKRTSTTTVNNGRFSLSFDGSPLAEPAFVHLEALDSTGNIIAYGRTPLITLRAENQGPITIWVGRPGRVSAAPASLSSGRVEFSAVEIGGVGVVYAGGRERDGVAVAKVSVFSVFSQAMIDTVSPLAQPRAGAVGMGLANQQALIFGGATADGLGAVGRPVAAAEVFDPTVGTGGLWTPLPTDVGARSHAHILRLGSGAGLITGGLDDSGAAIGTAAQVTTSGTIQVAPVAGAMVAPRVAHAVASASFSEGDGALVFGGLPDGSTAPTAERLVGQAFSGLSLSSPSRSFSTATTLPSGEIAIIGGRIAGLAQQTILVVTPQNGAEREVAGALSVARERHSTTLIGDELLICGGLDAAGTPLASCDVLDAGTLGLKKTLPLATARYDHVASSLETGPVLLAGGYGPTHEPIASIEIYTPPLPQ